MLAHIEVVWYIERVRTITVHEAKTHFSTLLAEVAAGEEIVIANAGKPIARLLPVNPSSRPIGIDDGRGWIAEDFDSAVLPEFEPYR